MELINFGNNDKTEHSSLIEKVYDNLALPDSTFIGARITKKMLVDSAINNGNALGSHDKKLITNVIQSSSWQNTLKPETLNVHHYVTDTVEYLEIQVIRVVLKNDIKNKIKLKHTSKLFHTLIPYPVILLLELGEELAISLADKRINQADKNKLVIEHIYKSDWLSSMALTENENDFLNDFSLKNVSSLNYFEIYQDFISMLIGLEISKISGRYISKNSLSRNNSDKNISTDQIDSESESQQNMRQCGTLHKTSFADKSNEDKTALLRELESLEAELSIVRNKIKKETQMNTKMLLNVKAKRIKQAIAAIKTQLA